MHPDGFEFLSSPSSINTVEHGPILFINLVAIGSLSLFLIVLLLVFFITLLDILKVFIIYLYIGCVGNSATVDFHIVKVLVTFGCNGRHGWLDTCPMRNGGDRSTIDILSRLKRLTLDFD